MTTTRTASSGLLIALCGCCTAHGPDPLLWEVVTCPECGQPCSCVGCVADTEETPG